MAVISFRSNEISCKIVYYGPGRCGKTTNLVTIHKALGNQVRGDLLSIDTAGDRTLFFDFLPMDLGTLGKFRIRVSLYTVPGQVRYNETRKLVLKGVDGIVFVADSLKVRRQANIKSLENLEQNLRELLVDPEKVPMVLQYNKRDLEEGDDELIPVETMDQDLNKDGKHESFPASAVTGLGVRETFRKICVVTVTDVHRRFLADLDKE